MYTSHNSDTQLFSFLSDPEKNRFLRLFYWLLVLTLAFWILLHPYIGIWHDSVLYTGQALNILYPGISDGDIFFFHGSQANFSLFPFFHALLIKILGIDQSALILTILGQLLLIGGAIYLVNTFLSPKFTLLFLILFTTLPGYQHFVLSPFELFATGRSVSEGLSLFFLAFILQRKFVAATIAITFAFLIHPLMALGPLVVFVLMQRWKTSLSIIISAILVTGIASIYEITPFAYIKQTFDAEWLALVTQRSPLIFLENWPNKYWNLAAFELSIILSANAIGTTNVRRLLTATALATFLGLLLSNVVGSHLSNVLVVQIQPWRVLWLLHIISIAAFVSLINHAWKTGYGKLAILLYISALLLINYIGGVFSFSIYLYWLWAIKHRPEINRIWYFGALILLIQSIMWYLFGTFHAAQLSHAEAGGLFWKTVLFTLQKKTLYITVILVAALFLIKPDSSPKISRLLQIVAILTFAISIALFDQRKPSDFWEKYNLQEISLLRDHIPENATVFWENNLRGAWFLLHRGNYISRLQTAGVVFSRKTAMEAKARSDRVSKFGFMDGIFHTTKSRSEPVSGHTDIDYLCADPNLDVLIISRATDRQPDTTVRIRNISYGVYYCDHQHPSASDPDEQPAGTQEPEDPYLRVPAAQGTRIEHAGDPGANRWRIYQNTLRQESEASRNG